MSEELENHEAVEEQEDVPVQEVQDESAGVENTNEADVSVDEAGGQANETGEKEPVEDLAHWKETALRSRAELENFRKRMSREKLDAVRYGTQSLLEELLPVIDNFEMGLMAAEQDQDSMIYQGMAMVKKQLDDFLEGQGVKALATEGEFDPNRHDAVAEEESDEVEPGHIIRTMRRGYLLNDRLLRAASVVVAKSAEAAGKNEEEAG